MSGRVPEASLRETPAIAFVVYGAKRMQQLINDLLAFPGVGRLTRGWEAVSLQRCLDAALRNLETACEETGAEITADQLPVVCGEPGLLTQLLQNLVGNALKFRGDDPPRVHVGVREAGDDWEFCCADNGIGIEEDDAGDVLMTREAFEDNKVHNNLHVVTNGVDAMAFLCKGGLRAGADPRSCSTSTLPRSTAVRSLPR